MPEPSEPRRNIPKTEGGAEKKSKEVLTFESVQARVDELRGLAQQIEDRMKTLADTVTRAREHDIPVDRELTAVLGQSSLVVDGLLQPKDLLPWIDNATRTLEEKIQRATE